MKSTSGAHYLALDHVRAVAALMVFVWHFAHGTSGTPVSFDQVPAWSPLVFFDQGHVGVALFMTLSGYLFAKLLDGKQIHYRYFLWNRCLRLFPLLIFVFVVNFLLILVKQFDQIEFINLRTVYWSLGGLHWEETRNYLRDIVTGFVLPSWPNGGWSITTELHFYLLLPALLFIRNRSPIWLAMIVLLDIAFRSYFYYSHGEVQSLSYWTIAGRLDQFIAGIIAFHYRRVLKGRHFSVAVLAAFFVTFYYEFDMLGGFYRINGYPSHSALWIIMPSIEGLSFAAMIAWYDGLPIKPGRLSEYISRIGEYSYSIYLLHFFFVFRLAKWIQINVVDISNFYVALPVSIGVFILTIPLGFLSMKFIEAPFLRHRKPYYRFAQTRGAQASNAPPVPT